MEVPLIHCYAARQIWNVPGGKGRILNADQTMHYQKLLILIVSQTLFFVFLKIVLLNAEDQMLTKTFDRYFEAKEAWRPR